ncbi:Nudix family hydrolase [Halopseudomonas sabulinigri]|uniref:8-oxo-dGTP diphosphatase n=2 Tax=Halopseudomonas sabulinigri TaxID=472181 RepID=A0ABP9ZNC9_9GAMM
MCFPRICRRNEPQNQPKYGDLMRRIHVIAAVIKNSDGQILIAKRPDSAHQGGLWEFPGGKLEPNESRFAALRRELQEELGIEAIQARPLIDIRHDYPDKSIRLDVWLVDRFSGTAHGAEGQPIRWVQSAELNQFEFPAANRPIVTAAQLPERYLITPDCDEQTLFRGLDQVRGKGITLIQLRQTQLQPKAYDALAQRVTQRYGDDFKWLLKGDVQPRVTDCGWHLNSAQLRRLWQQRAGGQKAQKPFSGLLAASCHNAEELSMAIALSVDFVTLSPVQSTASHPDAKPLGWEQAEQLITEVNLPVYLLGGLQPSHSARAFDIGAQGVAGINAFWPSDN